MKLRTSILVVALICAGAGCATSDSEEDVTRFCEALATTDAPTSASSSDYRTMVLVGLQAAAPPSLQDDFDTMIKFESLSRAEQDATRNAYSRDAASARIDAYIRDHCS